MSNYTKILMLFLALSLSTFAMSYKEFKQYIQKNAKTLQSQALSLKTRQVKNNILLRQKTPRLELEASRFNPQGASAFGYAVTASQNIRTNNYYEGLEDKAKASLRLEEAYIQDGKAGYFRTLAMIYTEYVYEAKFLALLKEEYTLSNKVSNMVKLRYESGSETKVAYLQAKTDTLALKTQMYSTKQAENTRYYELLAIAGLKKKVSLDKAFIYTVSAKISASKHTNTKTQILQAQSKVLENQARMNQSTIEDYEVYGGIEDEAEQSILRVGVSFDIPVFNQKSEEKMLAKLQMQQLSLDKAQLSIDMNAQKQRLKSSLKELAKQYASLKTLKSEQHTLYNLLEEGYQIAQGSIFVMMSAKNKLIQTQKSLLETQKIINTQKIALGFLEGQYND